MKYLRKKCVTLPKGNKKIMPCILSIILIFLIVMPASITADSFSMHYIFGTAQFSDGDIAMGARVTITSEYGSIETWVDGSGGWKVNCGGSEPNWPQGTNFSVKIVGCCGHTGWTGLAEGIVEGDETDMGHIILYPNQAPDTPIVTPHHHYVKRNTPATFSILSLDPNKHDISYRVNWDANGSGELSVFSSPHSYGESYICNHTWSEPGRYAISAIAKDEYGLLSNWSYPIDIIVYASNEPPAAPKISGPSVGLLNTSYTFEISSFDNTDYVQFYIDWGDNSTTMWTDFFASNESFFASHTWNKVGTYSIIVTVRDLYGDESSASFSVSIGITSVSIAPLTNSMFQIKTTIENDGSFSSSEGTYTILLNGAGVWFGSETVGTIPSLHPGESITIQSNFIVGLNPSITIDITVDTPETSLVTYSTSASLYFGIIRIK